MLAHGVFQVLHGGGPEEVLESYQVFAPLHFLRMLSYPEPRITSESLIVPQLGDVDAVTIVDFGCGLAQQSRALARFLGEQGRTVALYLADIPTFRKDFLLFLCERTAIDAVFLDCTPETPIPKIPVHQLCIATEFFEHVYDPVRYFEAIDARMADGGLLVTNSANHNREFMHVTPDLAALRSAIAAAGFRASKESRIYLKNCDNLR